MQENAVFITICTWWAGIFYLLNKIFLMLSECRTRFNQQFSITAWAVYLIGLPGWLAVFYVERNWIVGFVELGGAPAMTLGLINAINMHKEKKVKKLNTFALVAVIIGIGISFYDVGGLNKPTQLLELGVAIGFLVGTFLLAKGLRIGYGCYMLMNGSNATLMYVEGYPVLFAQQVISLLFVVAAFILSEYKRKKLTFKPNTMKKTDHSPTFFTKKVKRNLIVLAVFLAVITIVSLCSQAKAQEIIVLSTPNPQGLSFPGQHADLNVKECIINGTDKECAILTTGKRIDIKVRPGMTYTVELRAEDSQVQTSIPFTYHLHAIAGSPLITYRFTVPFDADTFSITKLTGNETSTLRFSYHDSCWREGGVQRLITKNAEEVVAAIPDGKEKLFTYTSH